MKKSIQSWGNLYQKNISIKDCINSNELLLSYGNLNSYGDAGIPLGQYGFKKEELKLEKDFISSSITIEKYISENEKMLYGLPGRNNVTLGGAVAADVHGKDGAWGDSFIRNIDSIILLLPNNDHITCSHTKNSEVFYSTIGGYGLTGSILGVKFQKNTIPFSYHYSSSTKKGQEIQNLLKYFNNNKYNYSVAWVNLLSKKKDWILETSTPLENINKPEKFEKININEFDFSLGLIGNNTCNSMAIINKIFFIFKTENKKIKNFSNVFYPLGFVSNTKNISPLRKIIQIQFSIPKKNDEYINELIELLIYNQVPLLCSVKRLSSNKNSLNLSFVQDGWTIAVDFSEKYFNHASIRSFYKKLIELEGKIYLAKDSTLNEHEFKNMYPNYKNWRNIVKKIDPNNLFQSELSKRLGLKQW